MIPKLIQKYRANLEKSSLKLTKALLLNDFPDGCVKDAIMFGYASDNLIELSIAVVINSAVASGKEKFLLSRSLLTECLKRDPNVSADRNLSGDTMKRIIGSLTASGLLERLTDASDKPGANRKAAVYQMIDRDVLELIKPTPEIIKSFEGMFATREDEQNQLRNFLKR